MNRAEGTRPYRQTERARRSEETGDRILHAARRIFEARGYAALTLAAVADEAEVTSQTVIRRFGDKEGLLAASAELAFREVSSMRAEAPVGDLPGIVANLVEHYEDRGGTALRLLADEPHSDAIAALARSGRALHRQWCARVFAPYVSRLSPSVRRRRSAQYVAICDVYTWKVLRRDLGLSPAQTRTALIEMLQPLTEGNRP